MIKIVPNASSRCVPMSRRAFLARTSSAALSLCLPPALLRAEVGPLKQFTLRAGKGKANLVSPNPFKTDVWAYNETVPGPEIRVRQGDRVRIAVENSLAEETTVHWHGLRVPNAMDGVPHLTQVPIPAGGKFLYEFDVPDAGTYWYHPHQRGFEQVGRGLYGPLIIEEQEPIVVDRDITWVLDDWRLDRDAQIRGDFGNRHDASHNGRVGNTVTINGQIPTTLNVKRGERVRLRLINAANARIFNLEFAGHEPWIIALDGQPVEPHQPSTNSVLLGPAMRADLIIDMTGEPNRRFTVTDSFYRDLEYALIDIEYESTARREQLSDASMALPPNTLPEPELSAIERHEIKFNGGMMGQMMMSENGGMNMMQMMRQGKMWTINGVAASGHVMDPLITLKQGRSYQLEMQNDTAWHHPIHFHGHSFRVVSRNGKETRYREWQDTVLMAPEERVSIAFVADNPGDWMFHCHIFEHQAAGMMGVVRVST